MRDSAPDPTGLSVVGRFNCLRQVSAAPGVGRGVRRCRNISTEGRLEIGSDIQGRVWTSLPSQLTVTGPENPVLAIVKTAGPTFGLKVTLATQTFSAPVLAGSSYRSRVRSTARPDLLTCAGVPKSNHLITGERTNSELS